MDVSELFGSSVKAASFDTGTTVRGRITEAAKVQRRELKVVNGEYEQGELLFWNNKKATTAPSNSPVMDPVFTLATANGAVKVFLKGQEKFNAALNAIKAAGVSKVAVGDFFSLTCTGEEPVLKADGKPMKGMNARKKFAAEYFHSTNTPAWASEISAEPAEADDSDPFA